MNKFIKAIESLNHLGKAEGIMSRRSYVLAVVLFGSLGLAGCEEEKKDPVKKEAVVQEKPKEPKKEMVVEEKPVEITLIDPLTENVVKSFRPEEHGFEVSKEAYAGLLKKWAKEMARGNGGQIGYDQKMTPDRIGANGEIVKGNPRIILDEAKLVEQILATSEDGGEIELPLSVTESGYKEEDVPFLDEVAVASYSTSYNSGEIGRSKNIELSAAAIDNVIVGVGDIVSFNTTVGPREKERGYQPAPEALNGKLVMGIGGGVCQTSSTLFNAVDKVGANYVERHHHSVSVGYVPEGRDATVSYGGLDFRFANTAGVPLLLKTHVAQGKLTVEVRTSKQYAAQMKQI